MAQRRDCDGNAYLTQEFVMEPLRHEQVQKIGPGMRARTGLERHGIEKLISMNDEGRTFPQIAGWIGRNLEAKEPCDEQVQGNVRKWAVAHHLSPRGKFDGRACVSRVGWAKGVERETSPHD
jgi:hypothetical protein